MGLLYIFSGLPGVGKTKLAKNLAQKTGAIYLRIDTLEQTLRESGYREIGGEGYFLAYQLAEDNLRLGLSVVADSVNPIAVTRNAWHHVAIATQVSYIDIEVICSDPTEHQARVESRQSDITGLELPTWQKVCDREYVEWETERLVIDTAGQTPEASQAALHLALDSPLEWVKQGFDNPAQ